MTPSLEGKTLIITGASAGIGRAAARLCAAQGAALVLTARGDARLQALADEIRGGGGRVTALAGDVGDEAHARRLVALAVDNYGGLDGAFNNAGTLGALGPTPGIALDAWQHTLHTNLTAAFLAAKHQIPALLQRGGGSLVFTGTFVGHTAGFPGAAAYAASKAGLVGLVQALATEFGPQGLRVNALLPGGTDTDMGREMNPTPEGLAAVARLHALQRLAQPEEIARAALFLLSEQSSFMTGTAMLVDGGVSVKRA
ncbi:MAG: SDR family oxidoreductase [Comamonadaceae bacterium]|nr:SDR family oxidoreductase [Comamonadaceae bacterium]